MPTTRKNWHSAHAALLWFPCRRIACIQTSAHRTRLDRKGQSAKETLVHRILDIGVRQLVMLIDRFCEFAA